MVEVARVTLQTMAAARAGRTQNVGPRLGGFIMTQPTLNWEAEDTCNELKNLILGVNNMFKSYSMPQAEQITIIKKWLGKKGLQFLETLTQTEQEQLDSYPPQ